jgi:N-acetylglucosaminyldiphosphoundecaprenol N-acetyl-beta-D-mannosaminyltransferase
MKHHVLSRIKFAHITVDLFTIDSLTRHIINFAKKNKKTVIGNHNQHSLFLFYKMPLFRRFYELCEYYHIDGMSLVFLGRIFKHSIARTNRITYVDLMPPLLEAMNRNKLKLYYLGSSQETIEKGMQILNKSYPDIITCGHSGYFDVNGTENTEILEEIKLFCPKVLMVGMSMPRQELWISQNYSQLPNAVVLPCGAAMDYIAGTIPTPPRIAGRLGLEWLFRMVAEPGRLWRRYLMEPFFIVKYIMLNHGGKMQYDL